MAVLSFLGNIHVKIKYVSFVMQKVNTTSLQVRSPIFIILNTYHPGKRVLPFTSRERIPASMTVEAALVLPLFVFLSIALLAPMKWLDTQRKLQTVTEMFCEDLSLYAYASGDLDGPEDLFADAAAALWLRGKLEEVRENVKIRAVQVPDENGNIVLEVEYHEHIPFFTVLSEGISVNVSAKRRCWNGYEGKLRKSNDRENDSESEQEMVYVGKEMTRYHTYRDCHYISNHFEAVYLEEAKKMLDGSGHRFTACAACICESPVEKENDEDSEETVYVTPGGRHYHSTSECSAMVSYVREVPLKEAAYLGQCSYCSRRSRNRE